MIGVFHKAGIKVVPNIKPCKAASFLKSEARLISMDALTTHFQYKDLHSSNALFHDQWTGAPVETRIWSSGVRDKGKGSWLDMTSQAGRQWWEDGVKSLIELGVDGMWK